MLSGIALGLAAALFQSFASLFSRRFVGRFEGGTLRLLAIAHLYMGAVSLPLAILLSPAQLPPLGRYGPPVLLSTFAYLFGQACFLLALRRTQASRVAPLLGLKILMLALISRLALGERFVLAQWVAVILSIVAAWLLNESGGRLRWQSVVWVLLACFGYCLSDLGIRQLVEQFMHLGLAHAALFSTCLCYALCGALSLALVGALRPLPAAMWLSAAPFAVAWFTAMLFLFGCFGSIGVVFGNIVQSTRGIFSIALGSVVAAAGYEHLEQKLAPRVLVARVAAAALMVAAVALFYLALH